jgi:hypothetical protein
MSQTPDRNSPLRLNLGSGLNPLPNFVNVDKFGSPDVNCDLEKFPWPWPDSSVDEICLYHVLEHLGASIDSFFSIVKELYRISKDGACVNIVVPHPLHDDFRGDPTHVRGFVPQTFRLFSKEKNRQAQNGKFANSPLGLYLDVDFELSPIRLDLDEHWARQLASKKLTAEQAMQAAQQYNNVVKQISVRWIAKKPGAPIAAAPASNPLEIKSEFPALIEQFTT